MSYVVAPDTTPDYSSVQEARLLAGGEVGLTEVFRSDHLVVYEVPSPSAIVTGAASASVRSMSGTQMVLDVSAPGAYRVAVHASPYWTSADACVTAGPDGMVRLVTPHAGIVRLDLDIDASSALRALLGSAWPDCESVQGG